LEKTAGVAEKAAKTDGKKADASKAESKGSAVEIGSSTVVKDHSLVPPPPPLKKTAPTKPAPKQVAKAVVMPEGLSIPLPILPPPAVATRESLQGIAKGASRDEVLSAGQPASRITMFDGGHLVEIYGYSNSERTLGTVRLSDGSVSSVDVRP